MPARIFKKKVTFLVECEEEERDEYKHICAQEDTSMSRDVRKHMRRRIALWRMNNGKAK